MKKLLERREFQMLIVLVAGVAIGALFYPNSRTEERIKEQYEQELQLERKRNELVQQSLQEEINKVSGQKEQLEQQTSRRIETLNIQIRELQSKTSEKYYRIVRPDGTIEERAYKESEVNESSRVISEIKEEFDHKIRQINQRYELIHRNRILEIKSSFEEREVEYKKTIAKYESEKIRVVNAKRYGLEVGYLSSRSYYGHVNVDLFGPIFIGVHTQSNFSNDHAVGAGIGLRF
jgi:hypothetical protein